MEVKTPSRVLFVCNNLNIGGPQKGLLALLERLDFGQVTPTIVSLQPGGELREHFARQCRVMDVSPLALALQVNRSRIGPDLRTLVRSRATRAIIAYLLAITAGLLRRPVNPWRQRTWYFGRHLVDQLDGEFDAAFAVSSGLSTYFVADGVRARRKYHWVIGDYSRTPIARRVDEHYFSRLDGGMAVSTECADIFAKLFPKLNHHELTVYTFPVPFRFYEATRQGTPPEFRDISGAKILTATRLEEGKGIPLAIRAADILRSRGIEFHWLVLGDGGLRQEINRDIAARHLQQHVKLCGFRSNVADYLREADVFVLPSDSEGRSVALDEAIAYRVVPVVTDFRTARAQVTDGFTGIVSDFSAEALANGLERALDPVTRESIEANLGTRIEIDPTPMIVRLAA